MKPKPPAPTEGKWELLPILTTVKTIHRASLGKFLIRAPKAPGGIAVTIGGLGDEEEWANARLLVASRRLLDACRALLKAHEDLMPGLKHILVKDYVNINTAPILAKAVIAMVDGTKRKR